MSSEDAYGHRTVTDAAVASFGVLTGDYARMHFDHHWGKASAIGGSIAHGLLSACWAVGAMTRHAPERIGVGDPEAVVAGFSVKFGRMVYVGDTLCVQHVTEGSDTGFEMRTQDDEVATQGRLTLTRGALPPAPEPFEVAPWSPPGSGQTIYADDLLEQGPRAEGPGRTLTEGEAVRFATEVGETNPLYLNRVFAESARFGRCVAPPMLTFCLAFSDFLDDLLRMPMPNTGFAGHLGDSWTLHAPVSIGDTVRGRYCVEDVRPSKSHPERAVVRFGLQVLNQHDAVVQSGAVMMMIGRRA